MWPFSVAGIALANPNAAGCCTAGQEQLLRWDANALGALNSGLNPTGVLSSQGLYHYPSVITDATINKPLLNADAIPGTYATQSVLGVVQSTADGRQAMFFFISLGDWSLTSTVINHAWIAFGTRNLFPGYKRVFLSTQVDDVLLSSDQVLKTSLTLTSSGIQQDKRTIQESHSVWLVRTWTFTRHG